MTGGPAVAETHCATLFLTGDRVYKVKKPLDLGFVDFSDPAARRHACRREVELNRRFAPDVYLGVLEIRRDGEEAPCDWAVVMRRMPEERRLSTLLVSGEDVTEPVRALARMLAAHHASARRSERIDAQGSPKALRARWESNLDALDGFAGEVLDARVVAELRERALRWVDGREALLEDRVGAGLVRDGHGDLLADDVFCLPDGPRVLDCLEFDDDLRAVDGLDDAACFAMDLERLGHPALARRFLEWFVEFTGRPRVDSLVQHYLAYRAAMRAKVACLRWRQGNAASAADARWLAAIALDHLRAGDVRLVLVGGTPGTGKTTVGGRIADALGAVLLRSDRIRKERAGLAPEDDATQPWQGGIYGPAATAGTYDELLSRAGELLAHGETVVLDASWAEAAQRDRARALARRAGALVVELRCTAPAEVAAERIERRAARRGAHAPGADASDATVDVAARMAAAFDPWPEAAELPTTRPLEETLRAAAARTAAT